jgi:hypothetical protein
LFGFSFAENGHVKVQNFKRYKNKLGHVYLPIRMYPPEKRFEDCFSHRNRWIESCNKEIADLERALGINEGLHMSSEFECPDGMSQRP